jgi:hypothetical protein
MIALETAKNVGNDLFAANQAPNHGSTEFNAEQRADGKAYG